MDDGPLGTLGTDAARVRLVLTRELETISVYEALARQADSAEARAFFAHLASEEKEHVAEATWLLRRLDSDQDADFQKNFSTEHFLGQAHPPASAPGPGAPPAAAVGFTVGSLRGSARRSSSNLKKNEDL